MLKYAAASVVLILGLAVLAPPALAAPGNDDCVNCAPVKPYDTEDPARIRQEMDRPRASDASPAAPANERATTYDRPAGAPAQDCADCPPLKRYDSTEVIKTSRDVDQSRVINTNAVVQVQPRVKEINKLVIHENETRNVGVIQHNHLITEKETHYVKRAPVYQRAVRQHRVVQRVQTVFVPVMVQPVQNCGCPCTCSGSQGAYVQTYVYGTGYGHGGHAQVSGYGQAYGYGQGYGRVAVQQVLVPVNVPAGYGYR